MSGGWAAAQPGLLKRQAALVGKGSLSSFDHFRGKEPKAKKTTREVSKRATRALAAKDNTLTLVARGDRPTESSMTSSPTALSGIGVMLNFAHVLDRVWPLAWIGALGYGLLRLVW